MATAAQQAAKKAPLHGLANRLVAHGLLTPDIAADALQQSVKSKRRLVEYLVQEKILGADKIAHMAAADFGLPLLDLEAYDRETIPDDTISNAMISKHHLIPLIKRGDQVYVAVSDPTNVQALNEIRFHSGLNPHAVLVEENKLNSLIDAYLHDQENESFKDLSDSSLDDLDISAFDDDDIDEEEETGDVDDAPIVRFVNKILLDAIKQGASDIHFEPYEKNFRVRFRIDGILHESASPPVNLAARITARIKVMSKLDISERRIPQDGHFKMKLSKKRTIDFRVSTCPTVGGEKTVMRVLDPTSAQIGIDELGYEPFQKDYFMDAIHKPQGMVLVTGPTGSGKTVSLYTALNILNTSEKNTSTAEDPVEINLAGINQVNVNPKAGLTFASALRSFLRQDPDIIMVGEIRDLETAEIGIKAAQTGHLVLSTLHTNSAPETLTRMVNMGVERFNIATSVNLIIAQRLARRLCKSCRETYEVTDSALLELGFKQEQVDEGITIYKAIGCNQCVHGYKGRVGLYETLFVSENISRVIMEGGNSLDILDAARKEGFQTLRESGLKKVKEGLTTIEEVNRVTKA